MSQANWTAVESYTKQFSAKGSQRVLPKIEAAMTEQYIDRQSYRDTDHLHPSELAKTDWCPRASYFKLTSTEESNPDSYSLRRLNIFAEGTAIHDKWQKWMQMTGCLSGMWGCKACDHRWMGKSLPVCPLCGSNQIKYREVPIYDEEHNIIGHADGEWEDHLGRALIEIKSIGLGTIRWDAPSLYEGYDKGDLSLEDLWERIKRPLLPHRRQINLYMYCRKIYNAIVIYEWKPTQEVKEFHLEYDEDLVRPMLDGAKTVMAAISAGVPPDKPATFRKSKECRFCPYKDMCWNG